MDMLLRGGTVVTCDADDRVVVGDVSYGAAKSPM